MAKSLMANDVTIASNNFKTNINIFAQNVEAIKANNSDIVPIDMSEIQGRYVQGSYRGWCTDCLDLFDRFPTNLFNCYSA